MGRLKNYPISNITQYQICVALSEGAKRVNEIFEKVNTVKTPNGVRQGLKRLIIKEIVIVKGKENRSPQEYSLTKKGEKMLFSVREFVELVYAAESLSEDLDSLAKTVP